MAKFCTFCGFSVQENDKFCPDCGAILRTREELQYCDHFCSECGAPIVTRTAEAVYKPSGTPPPAPQPKPAKTAPAQAKTAVHTTVPEREEMKEDEEKPGGGISGCSVIFWLIVLAGIVYGCYQYIYLPYMESKIPESGYTYGYGTTSIIDIPPTAATGDGTVVQPDAPDGDAPPAGPLDGYQPMDNRFDETTTQPVNPTDGSITADAQPDTSVINPFVPQPITPQYQIELLNFVWGPRTPASGGNTIGPFRDQPARIIVAEGEILNISPYLLPRIKAVVTFMDVEGNEISSETFTVNKLPIGVGESEKLYLETKIDSRMYKAKVELRDQYNNPYLVKKEADYSIRVLP